MAPHLPGGEDEDVRKSRGWVTTAVVVLLATGGGLYLWPLFKSKPPAEIAAATSAVPAAGQAKVQPSGTETGGQKLTLTPSQLKQIKLQPVITKVFRAERAAIGQIAFNEDLTTPIFSPFTGRVTKLYARLGEDVKVGAPLFDIDTPDVVQAQSDLINATVAIAKSRTQIALLEKAFRRQNDLFKAKAVSQKDWEQAQSDLRQAESDMRANEGLLVASRNKLRILGRNEAEVAKVENERQIDPIMTMRSPIAGTITTRKVGPGQYVRTDNTDPLFSISDLSTMWVRANVTEADIPFVSVGQELEVRVSAYPSVVFKAKVTYIAASVDPTTHRIAVRSEIANENGLLKPEMFASFKILSGQSTPGPGVPIGSVIRETDAAYVWIAIGQARFERRLVTLGLEQDGLFQILSGVEAGENVVVDGAVYLSNTRSSSTE